MKRCSMATDLNIEHVSGDNSRDGFYFIIGYVPANVHNSLSLHQKCTK